MSNTRLMHLERKAPGTFAISGSWTWQHISPLCANCVLWVWIESLALKLISCSLILHNARALPTKDQWEECVATREAHVNLLRFAKGIDAPQLCGGDGGHQ